MSAEVAPVSAADASATEIGRADPVIEARGLDLTFQTADGPVQALRDVNLTINKGDFVSFIGPSGCGKTTFLRVVAALEHPTGGAITVNGMSPDEARRNRAYGYVFQAAGLYPWRSIEKNIKLPLEIMGYDAAEQDRRVKNVLQLVDLEGFGKKYPMAALGGHAAARLDRKGARLRRRPAPHGRALRRTRRDRAGPL
jgi:NitT/TauT family transport system ATP-binding protein